VCVCVVDMCWLRDSSIPFGRKKVIHKAAIRRTTKPW
jgi:hypothetical protein